MAFRSVKLIFFLCILERVLSYNRDSALLPEIIVLTGLYLSEYHTRFCFVIEMAVFR